MRVFAFNEDCAAEGRFPGPGGTDLRRRVNGIALEAYEMGRSGASDGEASGLISEEIPKGAGYLERK
ncbi:unnamed protein product [Fusarium venenatum]|uniref:Uncharacterized protein n=1 Tax=Fusarium venenatum TaxID=56646 RepID=A0A2L2TL30_9HYPO|nr:uncharacterized protein FVRRES_01749 [Fusarium venenatum]CEI65237.1 unnamed protein product [Fusarium venenatum]